MGEFDALTNYTPLLRNDRIGEWISNEDIKQKESGTIITSFVNYTETVNGFIYEFYKFSDENLDLEMRNYRVILKQYGFDLNFSSVTNEDISEMNSKRVLAMIMGMIREERYIEGALLRYFQNGKMLSLLERLDKLE